MLGSRLNLKNLLIYLTDPSSRFHKVLTQFMTLVAFVSNCRNLSKIKMNFRCTDIALRLFCTEIFYTLVETTLRRSDEKSTSFIPNMAKKWKVMECSENNN